MQLGQAQGIFLEGKSDCGENGIALSLIPEEFLAWCLSPPGFVVIKVSQPGVHKFVMKPVPMHHITAQKKAWEARRGAVDANCIFIQALWIVSDLGTVHHEQTTLPKLVIIFQVPLGD